MTQVGEIGNSLRTTMDRVESSGVYHTDDGSRPGRPSTGLEPSDC